jgi:hypothetical protein
MPLSVTDCLRAARFWSGDPPLVPVAGAHQKNFNTKPQAAVRRLRCLFPAERHSVRRWRDGFLTTTGTLNIMHYHQDTVLSDRHLST